MSRLTVTLATAAALSGALAAYPTAAVAQAGQGTVIIYGNDPCPRESICVRAPESQRYRIPDQLRPSGTPQQRESWARKSKVLTTVGDVGVNSCSAVGPGGQVFRAVNRSKTMNAGHNSPWKNAHTNSQNSSAWPKK